MYLSSEDLSRNDYFVSDKLLKCYYLFHLSRFPPSVIFLFAIKTTLHTNRKMSQATSHRLKYISLPFPEWSVVRWCRCERQNFFFFICCLWKNGGEENFEFFLPFTPAPSYGREKVNLNLFSLPNKRE